ncbi:Nuclear hormone receptor family member nhr-34 [Aphelenchoides fujianensis]|nr:Nuclear hormone receptor family member nhr-34 [Aphelenchoides fujianensis]
MSLRPVDPSAESSVCLICGAQGAKHYGTTACLGCKGFFRRSILLNKVYKCIRGNNCVMTAETRNSCHRCRLQKCFAVGMKTSYLQGSRQKNGGDKRLPDISPKGSPTPPFVLINQALAKLANWNVSLGSLQIHKRWSDESGAPMDVINYFVEVERIVDEVFDEQTVGMQPDVFRQHCNVDLDTTIAIQEPGLVAPRVDIDWSLSHQFKDQNLKAVWCRQACYYLDYVSFLPDLELLDPIERSRLILANSTRIILWTMAYKTMKMCESQEALLMGMGQFYPLDNRADPSKSNFNEIVRILYRDCVEPMREMHLTMGEFAIAKAIYCFSSVSNLNDRSLQICMRLRDKYTNVLNEHLLNDSLCSYMDAVERITRIHGLLQVVEVTSNRIDKKMASIVVMEKFGMIGRLTYESHVRGA